MTFGPVQLFVLGFEDPDFRGQVLEEIKAVKAKGIIRLVNLEFFWKNKDGVVEVLKESDLSEKEQEEFSTIVRTLMGVDTGPKESPALSPDQLTKAMTGFSFGLSSKDIKKTMKNIPNNTAGAIVLIEHLWAKTLNDSVRKAGAFMVAQGMLTPEVLAKIGVEMAAASAAAQREEDRMYQ